MNISRRQLVVRPLSTRGALARRPSTVADGAESSWLRHQRRHSLGIGPPGHTARDSIRSVCDVTFTRYGTAHRISRHPRPHVPRRHCDHSPSPPSRQHRSHRNSAAPRPRSATSVNPRPLLHSSTVFTFWAPKPLGLARVIMCHRPFSLDHNHSH